MATGKLSRGPSIHRALRGLVLGLFGILWTIFAWHLTANSQIPYVGIIFPMCGVLMTLTAWGQAAYHFVHLASQQRFAEYDFVSLEDRPAVSAASVKVCTQCRADLQPHFRFCPLCGTKV